MKALIQRVGFAKVEVAGETVGEIEQGLLVLLGVEKGDDQTKADKLLHKIVNYRVFSDEQGKMNLSSKDIEAGLLIVSQFTLAAETKKGMRPGFSTAAAPDVAQQLYQYVLQQAAELHSGKLACGSFGADMQVSLLNDGPVTFMLEV